jgi:hypothetical protein
MRFDRIGAALAVVFLSACSGLMKSPAEGLTFQAPAGWQGTPGIMGRFQLWTAGDGKAKQVLLLMKLPGDVKLDPASFKLNDVQAANPENLRDMTIVDRRRMTLCGGQESLYFKMHGKSGSSRTPETIETVLSRSSPDATFMSTYGYPDGSMPDKEAEAAIYELCPAKG